MTSKDKYDASKAMSTFFIESREMLHEMEDALLDIEKGEYDEELINSIFRAAHTIKGSSGMFGLADIEKFTHTVENFLDNVRKGTIKIDSEMVSLLLECKDHIENMLDAIENTNDLTLDGETLKISEEMKGKLNKYMPTYAESEVKAEGEVEQAPAEEAGPEDSQRVLNKCWHISLRPRQELFSLGMDPQSFISYLNNIGEIKSVAVVSDAIPALEEMNSQQCYIGFEIDLLSEESKEKIEDVFEFIHEDCGISILPPKSSINDYIMLIESLPEEPRRIGEILLEIGTLTETELNEMIDTQMGMMLEKEEEEVKPLGEMLVDNKMVHEPVVEAALTKQAKMKKTATIRVDAEKLDNLINLVGELVISGANIKQLSDFEDIDKDSLTKSVAVMTRLIENIRDGTMNVRMVQIGETFRRFERVIRDLSKERGKEVELKVAGGDTELDKTLIEKIADPLMHLIRNAVDHGIDLPKERKKKAKPQKGTISLNAYHETGNIVIEVADDGDGLNRDKIYAKAVSNGLIQEDQDITDHELFQLIFEPGFSTADKVTNISGRGVGMDVVKRNIESLRGTVVLNSEEGKGTSIRIHLPLTLAIIDGFMVRVGDLYYVIPLNLVIECTEATKEELISKEGGNIINLRGEALPFLRLREFFDEEGEEPEIANIVIVEYRGAKTGLVVDNLIGEFQTVIKPLGELFTKLDWVSGATILGSGDVALILDVPKLIRNIQEIEAKGNIT